jgi:hypothetical protein
MLSVFHDELGFLVEVFGEYLNISVDQQVILPNLVLRDNKFGGAIVLHCQFLMYIYDSSRRYVYFSYAHKPIFFT